MQDKSAELLSQHSSHKWRHSAARATDRGDEGEGRYMHLSWDETREEVGSCWIYGAKEKAGESDGDGVAGD